MRKIPRQLRPEKKSLTSIVYAHNVFAPVADGVWSEWPLMNITQGVQSDQCIGRRVFVSKMILKFKLIAGYTNNSALQFADEYNVIRMMLIRINAPQAGGSNKWPSSFFAAPSGTGYIFDWKQASQKFGTAAKCLKDREMTLYLKHVDGGPNPTTQNKYFPIVYKFRWVVKVNRQLEAYTDVGTNAGYFVPGYFLAMYSDSHAPPHPTIFDFTHKVYFTDV